MGLNIKIKGLISHFRTMLPMSTQTVTSNWPQRKRWCHDRSRKLARTFVLATFDRDRWMERSELTPWTWGHYLLATCPFSCFLVYPLAIHRTCSSQHMWEHDHWGHKSQNEPLHFLIWNRRFSVRFNFVLFISMWSKEEIICWMFWGKCYNSPCSCAYCSHNEELSE